MNIEALRAETPGCEHVLHFNNAGAALMPEPVLSAQLDHLRLEAEIGGYEAAAAALPEIADTHDAIAELLGAQPDEIAVVENATRAWGAAFYGFRFAEGDRILTATASYASNYIAMLQVAKETGAVIDVVPDDEYGQVDVAALERMISGRTRLIAITHIPTNGGLINPVAEVGSVANRAGIPFLVDACQSVGQMPLNVDEIGCDMLSATGRKFLRGPRGTGFLYVRLSLIERLEPPFLDLHAAEWVARDEYVTHRDRRRFETWEGHVAGKIGLGVAVRYSLSLGLGNISDRVQLLSSRLRAELAAIPGVAVWDKGRRRSGIVTFTHPRLDAVALSKSLASSRMNTSVLAPSSARLDSESRNLPDLVRASVHYYNTMDEIERFCRAVSAA